MRIKIKLMEQSGMKVAIIASHINHIFSLLYEGQMRVKESNMGELGTGRGESEQY